MWTTVSILVFCSVRIKVFAEYDAACQTPNGEWATCKSVYYCPTLLKLIQITTLNTIQRKFLKESQCGYDVNPLVCCGTESAYISTESPRENSTPTATEIKNNPAIPNRSSCGFQELEKILGGKNAALDEFPWIALLQYKNPNGNLIWACGGSIINDRYILTAAHCVTGEVITKFGTLVNVRLGEWNIDTDVDCVPINRGIQICNKIPPQNIGVDETIAHNEYRDDDINRYNDIALVRLSMRIDLNHYARPVCLPLATESAPVRTKVVVAGWGRTESRSRSAIKQKLEVSIAEKRKCADTFSTARVTLIDTQICAGGEANKDSCTGDSGGPLMHTTSNDSSQWYIEGIVSFGADCGTEGWPGIYTKVASHLGWIHRTVRD